MKVKSESEVTQSCLTLHDPMDCSLPGSSFHGIFQARVLEWGAIALSAIKLTLHPPPMLVRGLQVRGLKARSSLISLTYYLELEVYQSCVLAFPWSLSTRISQLDTLHCHLSSQCLRHRKCGEEQISTPVYLIILENVSSSVVTKSKSAIRVVRVRGGKREE